MASIDMHIRIPEANKDNDQYTTILGVGTSQERWLFNVQISIKWRCLILVQ